MTEHQCRLRIRLPNGAELEAAGSPDYVRSERDSFLASQAENAPKPPQPQGNLGPAAALELKAAAANATGTSGIRSPVWDSIIETAQGTNLQLRAKLQEGKTDRDACLILLAAAQKVLNIAKPTAAQVARWLRASGYPVQRVDRAIAEAVQKGDILASGSRRARRYELTGPGRVKGFLLAQQLSERIEGPQASHASDA